MDTNGKKLIILGSAWPLRGGLAAFNERLALAFQQEAYQVQIITFSLQYPRILFPGKSQYSDSPKPSNLSISVRVNSINPLNWLRVARFIRRENPDLLIIKFWIPFMAPCLGTIARGAKRNKHTRVISILDNVIPHEKRPGDKALIRYFLQSVDGFVAMSKSVSEDLLSLKPAALFAMNPHPLYDNFGDIIDRTEARSMLNLSTDCHYILFFGFIRDYKGLDLLLEAMNIEKVRALNVKLIVAGEFYSDPAPYYEQIDRYGIDDKVIMATDFIPDEKVGAYFSACDLVVQPYKSATQSGVTQIAYHFEKPMVVTDVGGLAEIVPHGKAGYVVSPEADAIADAIHDFFTHAKGDSFADGIKEEKKKYSWQQMVSSIENLFQKITNSKPC